ncbi:MAG: DMT family transporter [Acidimicrobiia bacterium]|nr:DMT family transporter [Acidimicrobiia bacterium]MDH3397687.1 DMT family transporter [Acidimicrobiia bacterium]
MQSRSNAMVSLLVLTAAWGTIPLIVRSVDLSTQQLVAMRLLLGALPLLAVLLSRGVPRLGGSQWLKVIGLGGLLAFHWVAFFRSLSTTTVAIALVLVYLAPVAMATLAPMVLGEPLRTRAAGALAVALAGVVLVARPGEGATTEGVIFGLLAAASFTGLVLAGKPIAQQIGPLRLAALETSVAAVLTIPWAVTAFPEAIDSWWQLAILGVLLTGLAGYVYWRSVAALPVATVAVLSYMEPASAVVWAAFFLGETGDLTTWSGVVLVLAAGAAAGLEGREALSAEQPISG